MKQMKIEYCQNCGHEKHDGPLWRTEVDYDGREYQIEVCRHYRGKKDDKMVKEPVDRV